VVQAKLHLLIKLLEWVRLASFMLYWEIKWSNQVFYKVHLKYEVWFAVETV